MTSLLKALHGKTGELTEYLAARNEFQIRDDMLALLNSTELRDRFAMAALTGQLANSHRLANMEKSDVPSDVAHKLTVAWAYKTADAMIEERAKEAV